MKVNDLSYEEKNGKYIFSKEGVYFSLTEEQVKDMQTLCEWILDKLQFERGE